MVCVPNFKIYRICVINSFRNSTAVLEYKEFGIVKEVNAWIINQSPPEFITSNQSITVFLNYEQILDTKNKEEAKLKLTELLQLLPEYASMESNVLFRALYRK